MQKTEKIHNFIDILFEYLIFLSQIPSVEWQTYSKVTQTRNNLEELEYAIKSYNYLSKGTTIFFDIPAIFLSLSKKKIEPTKTQVLVRRGLEMIHKDFIDLEDDLKEGSNTPAVAFYNKYGKNRLS